MFSSRFMPCSGCGASVEREAPHTHECDPERKLDYEMFALRDGVARFDDDLLVFLSSPTGQFETFVAARQVRRRA